MTRRILVSLLFNLVFLSIWQLSPHALTWLKRVALEVIYAPEKP